MYPCKYGATAGEFFEGKLNGRNTGGSLVIIGLDNWEICRLDTDESEDQIIALNDPDSRHIILSRQLQKDLENLESLQSLSVAGGNIEQMKESSKRTQNQIYIFQAKGLWSSGICYKSFVFK